jgi:translation initiation factor 2B subunit (eIF-2B alpha/beta/delta family)
MNRFAALPLILVLFALALSACGDDDDAPTKAEFAEQAEKICQNAEKQLDDIGQTAESPSEIADAVDKVIDQSRSSLEELRSLERPEGDAGEAAQKFVDALGRDIEDQGIPALEDLRDALKENDQKAAQEAAQKLQAIETSNTDQLAKEVGATDCGE